jgi:photosystem II stability/assembly factor-like uncharacterized protein
MTEATSQTELLIATRKGLWIATADPARRTWTLSAPHFLGQQCHHAVRDPRDGRTLLLASRQWHLGPTVFRSLDDGQTWTEATTPPRFPTGEARGRAVDHVFWLTPGHPSRPGEWYCATSPQGLFRSEDGGASWAPVSGYNDHPDQRLWVGDDKDQTPDGGKLHSILVDPRHPDHLWVSSSSGGTFRSLDGGATWQPFNKGIAMDFYPPLDDGAERAYGHDPHCVVQHPTQPDRLYMQNHCGLYRLDLPADRWERIGRNMPAEVGDIGFPVATHPRDPDTAWVFPMVGTDDWPRTPPGGRPAVFRTRDAGAGWTRLDAGFPTSPAWWTVKRQCLVVDDQADEGGVGVYFGTTQGEVWWSADEGDHFNVLARDLPQIHALSAGRRRG